MRVTKWAGRLRAQAGIVATPLLLLAGFISAARADDVDLPPPYELRVPISEVRSSLNGLMDDQAARVRREAYLNRGETTPETRDVLRLISSYRGAGVPNATPIKDGPYLNYIVSQLIPTYPDLYKDSYQEQFESSIGQLLKKNIVELFDIAMNAMNDHIAKEAKAKACKKRPETCAAAVSGVPDLVDSIPLLKEAQKKLGSCLITKVVQTQTETQCTLDANPATPAPHHGFFVQAWMKVSCPLDVPFMNNCRVRRTIFDIFKPKLIWQKSAEGRKLLTDLFNKEYPAKFRAGFLDFLKQAENDLPAILVAKFHGEGRPLLDVDSALVEVDSPQKARIGMAHFAEGLKADISSAVSLLQAKGPDAALDIFV